MKPDLKEKIRDNVIERNSKRIYPSDLPCIMEFLDEAIEETAKEIFAEIELQKIVIDSLRNKLLGMIRNWDLVDIEDLKWLLSSVDSLIELREELKRKFLKC